MDDWGKFVKEQKEIDLKKIINDENLRGGVKYTALF